MKVEHIINNQIEAKYHVINYDINAELKTDFISVK